MSLVFSVEPLCLHHCKWLLKMRECPVSSNLKQFSPRHYFCERQLLRLCCEQTGPLLEEVRGTNELAVPFLLVRKVARGFEDAIMSHVARATGASCLFLACEQ